MQLVLQVVIVFYVIAKLELQRASHVSYCKCLRPNAHMELAAAFMGPV